MLPDILFANSSLSSAHRLSSARSQRQSIQQANFPFSQSSHTIEHVAKCTKDRDKGIFNRPTGAYCRSSCSNVLVNCSLKAMRDRKEELEDAAPWKNCRSIVGTRS
jgi:hypothetical protein